ncbi:MAG: septum formation initiator family protein [Alicyclobacillus herbarius]|uniref:septum formation initiator family protein n=1 Tax=Alicyclobacillus herbarius TaxID=122960 RepID=UPI0023554333|nr:septum formation initiator family protein [Alicyclobacillus herbarius]MCL6631697.1 septum formation initiator family protein [Alicyclobacillus herbarius]
MPASPSNAAWAAPQREPVHERAPVSAPASQPRRERFSRFDRISIFGCIVASAGILWFIATQSAQIDRVNYHIASLEQQTQQVEAENAALTKDVDELKRPARILSIALHQLHMKYANPIQIQGTPNGQ